MPTILLRKPNDNNVQNEATGSSKQTASMADDPLVVLETASASGSAYTSPGRSADPVEDLDKSTDSDGQAANNTADDDSLFGEASAFDQAAKSDPLFTSEIHGHARDTNLPSVARDSSPLHRSMDRNPARQSSVEDFANVVPKSQSARYSDIRGNDMEDQSPRSTESEEDIWLTVSEIPLFTEPTTAPPPSRAPPLLKQKPLAANANGKENGHAHQSAKITSITHICQSNQRFLQSMTWKVLPRANLKCLLMTTMFSMKTLKEAHQTLKRKTGKKDWRKKGK